MLKYYKYSKIKDDFKSQQLLEKLYNVTKKLEIDYPNHYYWFHEKFCKELDGKVREIVFCLENDVPIGVALLKNSKEEKKICTIYVEKTYRNIGIGTQLLLKSFAFLNTTKPLITMPEYKVKEFYNIIKNYNWEKTEKIESCYSEKNEIVFNGILK